MRLKGWRGMFLTMGSVGCLTVPGMAEVWHCQWDHPCDSASQLTCQYNQCWCLGDWKYAPPEYPQDNWNPWATCGNYPDLVTEDTTIEHANIGWCTTGGAICDNDSTCGCIQNPEFPCCPGAYCCKKENYLLLEVTTQTIGALNVETTNTALANDKLAIRVESEVGGNILTTGYLILDATVGPITLIVRDGATLRAE